MDSRIHDYIQRAQNEMLLSETIKEITENDSIKSSLQIPKNATFYSSVISHAYYAIFYAAKALLQTKKIETKSPNIHKKTYETFKKNFVDIGILDVKLLRIYKKMVIRADTLLEIFRDEKGKRGRFTYKTIPQANKGPAIDSVKNAKIFLSSIITVIEK